ncbi:MAG: hypothetical protein IKC51_09405 [Myxococcaceae bacterium]|nr:hypothetical protein [Myxococcaceae bacterium]
MRYFSLSLSLLALLSLSLGCLNEEGASFGETGMENTIVADAGPPPGDQTSDASAANQEEPPPELPLVDPDCPSLRLMEFKSAEGGLINLAFTELHIPKKFLSEKTKITIARYGVSEKASQYDYYIFLPKDLKATYRKFSITAFIEKKRMLRFLCKISFGGISIKMISGALRRTIKPVDLVVLSDSFECLARLDFGKIFDSNQLFVRRMKIKNQKAELQSMMPLEVKLIGEGALKRNTN